MNNKSKNIISTALSHHIAVGLYNSDDKEKFPNKFSDFFSGRINPNSFMDKTLISKTELHDHVDWNSMERNKVIRVLARDISLINRFDFSNYNFTTIELYPIFLQHPDLIFELEIDLKNLTTSEAILLLECNQDLIDHINIFDCAFNKRDMIQIIKKFKMSEKIMKKLNLKSLDHYSARRLLCETGDLYVNKLNLETLKPTDWLEILEERPELLDRCNLKAFEINDCYLLTKLVLMFPELDYMIYDNVDKLSGLGWEKLIKGDLEKYQDLCKWEKLSESNWNNIVSMHPSLKSIKQKYYLF